MDLKSQIKVFCMNNIHIVDNRQLKKRDFIIRFGHMALTKRPKLQPCRNGPISWVSSRHFHHQRHHKLPVANFYYENNHLHSVFRWIKNIFSSGKKVKKSPKWDVCVGWGWGIIWTMPKTGKHIFRRCYSWLVKINIPQCNALGCSVHLSLREIFVGNSLCRHYWIFPHQVQTKGCFF